MMHTMNFTKSKPAIINGSDLVTLISLFEEMLIKNAVSAKSSMVVVK